MNPTSWNLFPYWAPSVPGPEGPACKRRRHSAKRKMKLNQNKQVGSFTEVNVFIFYKLPKMLDLVVSASPDMSFPAVN